MHPPLGPNVTTPENDWLRFATTHAGALLKLAGAVALAAITWTTLNNRVDRVEAQGVAIARDVEAVRLSMREAQQRDEARFNELDRQREEHGRALVELRTRLEGINTTLDKVDKSVALLLDRLGPAGGAYRGQASSEVR